MEAANSTFKSSIDYVALGNRLRAYRVGASLLAEDVAERLGISRAVVYRLEKGEIVKIETLERLAHLLDTTLASLLGVEVEYYSTALGLFERMRQLEESSDRILAHFDQRHRCRRARQKGCAIDVQAVLGEPHRYIE